MEKSIEVNGIEYVRKDSVEGLPAKRLDDMEFVICRTYSAGVFAGYLDRNVEGKERTIYKSRRIWYWKGAASLSQLAVDGTSEPKECKFPCVVEETDLTEVIEIIPCTERAKESILGVPVWKK